MATVDDDLGGMFTENPAGGATAECFDAAGKFRSDCRIIGKSVPPPNKLGDRPVADGPLGFRVNRPSGLGLHWREELRIEGPHVARHVALIVAIIHGSDS